MKGIWKLVRSHDAAKRLGQLIQVEAHMHREKVPQQAEGERGNVCVAAAQIDLDQVSRTCRQESLRPIVLMLSVTVENGRVGTAQPEVDLDVILLARVADRLGAVIALEHVQYEVVPSTDLGALPVPALPARAPFRAVGAEC